MPLKSGLGSMSANIKTLLTEGYKKKQAIAIAAKKAGKKKK
jgi:uncharacterized protein YdaT